MKNITKENISRIALQLFYEKGYENVTIQDICNACDITKPTFYHYVEAKENLILDIYDSIIDDLMNQTFELLAIESSYERFVFIFSKLINDTKKMGSNLVSQLYISNLKENKNSFFLREPLTKLCTIIIKQAQDNEEINNKQNPEDLYFAIAHLFTGYCVMWAIIDGDIDLTQQFFHSVNVLCQVVKEKQNIYQKYK